MMDIDSILEKMPKPVMTTFTKGPTVISSQSAPIIAYVLLDFPRTIANERELILDRLAQQVIRSEIHNRVGMDIRALYGHATPNRMYSNGGMLQFDVVDVVSAVIGATLNRNYLTDKTVNSEKGMVKASIDATIGDPHFVDDQFYERSLYGSPRLAKSKLSQLDLESITVDELRERLDQYMVPSNALLIVTGDISEYLVEDISQNISQLPSGEVTIPVSYKPKRKRWVRDRQGRELEKYSEVRIGWSVDAQKKGYPHATHLAVDFYRSGLKKAIEEASKSGVPLASDQPWLVEFYPDRNTVETSLKVTVGQEDRMVETMFEVISDLQQTFPDYGTLEEHQKDVLYWCGDFRAHPRPEAHDLRKTYRAGASLTDFLPDFFEVGPSEVLSAAQTCLPARDGEYSLLIRRGKG